MLPATWYTREAGRGSSARIADQKDAVRGRHQRARGDLPDKHEPAVGIHFRGAVTACDTLHASAYGRASTGAPDFFATDRNASCRFYAYSIRTSTKLTLLRSQPLKKSRRSAASIGAESAVAAKVTARTIEL